MNAIQLAYNPIHHKRSKHFGLKTASMENLDLVGNATFTQYVDHSDPSAGTFEQRFWWDGSNYKTGGPVFLFNPGESAADDMIGYLGNTTIPGRYAQEFNGAAIVIERKLLHLSIFWKQITYSLSIRPLLGQIHTLRYSYCRDIAIPESP